MADFYVSTVLGAELTIKLALFTGRTGEVRISGAVPDTSLRISKKDVLTAEIRDDENGRPELVISTLKEGVSTVIIDSGGVNTYTFTVMDKEPTGLRWSPRTLEVASSDTIVPPDPFPPGSTGGPYSSMYGQDYWLQRDESDVWYIWWDIDADPAPDVRRLLSEFLANDDIVLAYRNDVEITAISLGYPTG